MSSAGLQVKSRPRANALFIHLFGTFAIGDQRQHIASSYGDYLSLVYEQALAFELTLLLPC